VSAVGFHVPDLVWCKAIPTEFDDRVLCLACFTRLADENGIEWDREIQFYPVSLKTHAAFCAAEEGERGTT